LKRQRLIRPLFDRNRADVGSIAAGCIRLLYRVVPRSETGEDVPVQVGFAPGRGVRPAVARNRVKRLAREAYRHHQHLLADLFTGKPDTLTLMVLFRGDPAEAARKIPRDLVTALRRLAARLGGNPMNLQ
jgi:ribonuclease P protein component